MAWVLLSVGKRSCCYGVGKRDRCYGNMVVTIRVWSIEYFSGPIMVGPISGFLKEKTINRAGHK